MTAPPREPTQEMLRAGRMVVLVERLPEETPDEWIARFYRAMYDAAPAPTVAQPAEPVLPCLERGCPNPSLMPESEYCRYHAARQPAAPPATDDLVYALTRMCIPMDDSRLSGVTAQEDARCMEIIRAHIERQAREIADRDAKLWEARIRADTAEAERDALRECVKAADAMYAAADHTGGNPGCNKCDAADAFLAARAKVGK